MSYWIAGATIGSAVIGAVTAPDGTADSSMPDFSELVDSTNAMSELATELGLDQLDWATGQWPSQEALMNEIVGRQTGISSDLVGDASAAMDRWGDTFRPIEDQLVAEAESYNSIERRQSEAAKASADVAQAFDAQRQNAKQNLASYGIDPTQLQQQALDLDVRKAQATAQAQAANEARDRTAEIGRELRTEAIGLGRDTVEMANVQRQTAGYADQVGANVQNSILGTQSNLRNITPYLNSANQSLAIQGSALSGQAGVYDTQLANDQANAAAWGDTIGTIGSAVGYMGANAADGGLVQGPGGPKGDAIPASMSNNEYVVPAEVVLRKGTEFFDKLVDKTRQGIAPPDQQSLTTAITSTSAGQQALNTAGQQPQQALNTGGA